MRLLVVLLACHSTAAAWKAGLARVDITPEGPVMMAGYASRDHASEGVRQHLFAKALAIEDDTGRRSVMVTFDLESMLEDVAGPVAERALRLYGLKRDQLLLNCSHTHSGPVLRGSDPYGQKLIAQTAELIGAALKDLAPASLSFEYGNAGLAVNRRRVTAATRHYPQPVDHDVLVIAVRDPGGKLRGVVFGYACHATVLSDYQINGDWPGYAQAELEKAYPGATALFVAGCGADQNPLPRRTVELAELYGKVMREAVSAVLGGKMKPLEAPLVTALEKTMLPLEEVPSKEEWMRRTSDSDRHVAAHAGKMLARMEKEGSLPGAYPYTIQIWRFGKAFTLIALAGEVVVDYSLRLRAAHGWNTTWVASYSNDVFAYIPSARVRREGGYEGITSMIAQGQPAPFTPAVEETIVHKVERMMERTEVR